jgi:hypothetical protein
MMNNEHRSPKERNFLNFFPNIPGSYKLNEYYVLILINFVFHIREFIYIKYHQSINKIDTNTEKLNKLLNKMIW